MNSNQNINIENTDENLEGNALDIQPAREICIEPLKNTFMSRENYPYDIEPVPEFWTSPSYLYLPVKTENKKFSITSLKNADKIYTIIWKYDFSENNLCHAHSIYEISLLKPFNSMVKRSEKKLAKQYLVSSCMYSKLPENTMFLEIDDYFIDNISSEIVDLYKHII